MTLNGILVQKNFNEFKVEKNKTLISAALIIMILFSFRKNWHSQEIASLKNAKTEIMCDPENIKLNKVKFKDKEDQKDNKDYLSIKLKAINAKKSILKKYGFDSIAEYGIVERKNRKNRKLNKEIFDKAYEICGSEIDFVPLSSL